jgi:Fe-S cluster assembly protein SufB
MADVETIELVRGIEVDKYKYGFETDIESDYAPKGLNEDIVRFISAKKNEPQWMLDWRLEAYRVWQSRFPQDRFSGSALLRSAEVNTCAKIFG